MSMPARGTRPALGRRQIHGDGPPDDQRPFGRETASRRGRPAWDRWVSEGAPTLFDFGMTVEPDRQ